MRLIALSLVLAVGIIPAGVHGASGDRDCSYGGNRVIYADFPEPVSIIAIQADNKLINGGQCYVPAENSGGQACDSQSLANNS